MNKPKDTAKDTGQSGADQSQQQGGSGAGQQGGTDQSQGQQSGDQNGQETAEAAAARIAKENETEANRVAEENRVKEEARVKEENRVAQANRDREAAAERTRAAARDREQQSRGINRTPSKSEQRAKDAPDIITRDHEVHANRTPREAQIARADEAMRRKTDDSTDGAKAIMSKHDEEEAIYEKLKDAPPTSGRARDENTPTEILADGTKVWGTPAA